MKELGRGSGVCVVRDEAGAIHVVDGGTAGLYTTVFVLALITGIPGLGGAVLLATGIAQGSGLWMPGLVLLAVGLLAGFGLRLAWRSLRRRNDLRPEAKATVVVFDLPAGVLRDGRGNVLAPIDACRVHQKMQLTSSSPQLVVSFPTGTLTLVRGNPFAGGLGSVEWALHEAGIG